MDSISGVNSVKISAEDFKRISDKESKLSDITPREEMPKVSVTSSQAAAYFPNINTISAEDRFDMGYDEATELSNGSKLLQPVVLNSGRTEIVPSENEGEYDIIFTSSITQETSVRTVSEDDLKSDKWHYAGEINKIGDDEYEITHIDDNGGFITEVLSKAECIEIMKEEGSHF